MSKDNTKQKIPTQKERIITTLGWMVKDMKWKTDQLNAVYSSELLEAINLLEELKNE